MAALGSTDIIVNLGLALIIGWKHGSGDHIEDKIRFNIIENVDSVRI